MTKHLLHLWYWLIDTFAQWILTFCSGLITGVWSIKANPLNKPDPFSDSIYEEQTHLAERELFSFIAAVTALYGPEQAKLSTEDWLQEADFIDSPPRSETQNWRAVTIAASARLASRVKVDGASDKIARSTGN